MKNAQFPYRTPRFMASALVVLSWGSLVITFGIAIVAGFSGGPGAALAALPVVAISLFGILFGELCCAVFDIAKSVPSISARGP